MKIQTRQSVFETNSSSTHSMTIAMKSDFDAWQGGTLLRCGDKFISVGEGKKENVDWMRKQDVPEDVIESYLSGDKTLVDLVDEEYIIRWDIPEFWHSAAEDEYYEEESYLETFFETFKTPKGEEIVVWGDYGYNG